MPQTQTGLLIKDMVLQHLDLPVISIRAILHLMLVELLLMVMVLQQKAPEMQILDTQPNRNLRLQMLTVNILLFYIQPRSKP